jgi:hypothetical protein
VLPFFILVLALRESTWPRRILITAFYGFAVLGVVILVMWPFWPGYEQWAVLQSGQGAGRSLFALLVLVIRSLGITENSFNMIEGVIYSVFGIIYLWGLWNVWQGARTQTQNDVSLQGLFVASFAAFFGYILLVAPVFHAWYLIWVIPLAAILIPNKPITSATFASSLVALLIIPYFETVRVWFPYLNENHLVGHLIGVPLLLVPIGFSLLHPISLFSSSQGFDTR